MNSVKPLTVVTKLGTWLPRRGVNIPAVGGGGEQFIHEDCVTLADAERYAREKVEEFKAVLAGPLAWRDELTRNLIAHLESKNQNHGSFYLETQADLVLKARLDELEQAVTNRYEVSLRGMQSRIEQLTNRVKEIERIEMV